MRAQGLHPLFFMEELQVMGFSAVFKSLPRLWKLFYRCLSAILELSPNCIVLIDYPGFNLRLARALRKQKFKGKIVQYIAPSVWAHGKHRIDWLAQSVDLLLPLYPFEAAYFSHTALPVAYVGHPLVDLVHPQRSFPLWRQELGIPHDNPLIALFPGSRPDEIASHAPLHFQTAQLLQQQHNISFYFAVAAAHDSLIPLLEREIQKSGLTLNRDVFVVPPAYHYALMADCQLALAKLGTVTLELALHAVPTVTHYSLSYLNYLMAKYVLRLKLPYYCIVNLLGGSQIFPEYVGCHVSSRQLAMKLIQLIHDVEERDRISDLCKHITASLGVRGAYARAAEAIEKVLSCSHL